MFDFDDFSMIIRKLANCPSFVAGDKTILKEILHPNKADLALRYSLAHAVVPVDTASIAHRLKTSEVYYMLSGTGIMHIEEETAKVEAGDTIYIPPNAVQWIENTGDQPLAFLCIVDPAWREEDEEVL